MDDEKNLPLTERIRRAAKRMLEQTSKAPELQYPEQESDVDLLTKLAEEEVSNHALHVDLHNGFNIVVAGHAKSVDALKELLIPAQIVKSIRVFDRNTGNYATRLSYTALKGLREAKK